MQLAHAEYERRGDRKGLARILTNLGIVYRDMGDYANAMQYYRSALEVAEEIGDRKAIAQITGNIGQLHTIDAFDDYNLSYAEELLLRAIDFTNEISSKPILLDFHKWLAELYQKQGKWQQAHYHLQQFYEIREEVQAQETHKKATQLEHRRQITDLEKQRAIERAEAEIQRMQTERELGNATMQLLAQTELLRDLRNDLLKIARRIPPSEPAARELRDRIKNLPCESVDWEKFDRQFKAVHPDFIRTLTERAPDLTATEVRICTMLRMNLKSHEIAGIFCITEAGVEFHRRNIRRKLKLGREEKLPIVLGAM
jgi:tetratricopeptide (TPR) repeat protein/DNA-binding CsgD family transcriptional regulator